MGMLDGIRETERKPHEGVFYTEALSWFHRFLNPKNYFEIGTLTGSTLKGVSAPTIAVDPAFQISSEVIGSKPELHLYQKTSDDFFRNHNLSALFGRPAELCFLDGLHWYEFLLRDFANTEKQCRRNSVIILHDCVPTDLYVARRSVGDMADLAASVPNPQWWAGDVWKTVAILKKFRPDLRIHVFDAPPTGLVCITNLDPDSTLIDDNYFDLVDTYADRDQDLRNFQDFHDNLNLTSTREISSFSLMSRFFWL